MHVEIEGTNPTLLRFGPPIPTSSLRVTLFRHQVTDVHWFGSGTAVAKEDAATLAISLDPSILHSDDCLEVRVQDDGGSVVELEDAFFTYGPDGWHSDPDRPKELWDARAEYFTQPLSAPDATTAARSFYAVALIESLLLTQNSRVPGVEIYALRQPLGSEHETIGYLSGLAGELFGRTLSAEGHAEKGLPCVALKFGCVRADTAEMAVPFVLDVASRLADLLGFNRAARPRVVALAVLDPDNPSTVRGWVDPERSQYTGNLAGGFISGESTQDLLQQWTHMETDPRVALWLSQINDARAERRWEYRVLRYFNLLEGISKGSLGVKAAVLDRHGQQLLQSNGQPYSTNHARGAVYAVIAGLCRFRGDMSEDGFCSHTPLWELCQHWTTVRNQVAHAGAWESEFKVSGTANVEAFLEPAPQQRRHELEASLAECVRMVVDGVIFRGYLPL